MSYGPYTQPPILEIPAYDELENVSAVEKPIVIDQDEDARKDPFVGVSYGYAPGWSLRPACMDSGGTYKSLPEWMALDMGLNGTQDTAGRRTTCMDLIGKIRLQGQLASVKGKPPIPKEFSKGAAFATMAMGRATASEVLPQLFIDQDQQGPLLAQHLGEMRGMSSGLRQWRESFFEALGCMLGQAAITGWLDDMARRQLRLRSPIGVNVPEPGSSYRVMSDAAGSLSTHAIYSAQLYDRLQTHTQADPPVPHQIGPGHSWLSAIYDSKALCWNSPLSIQEMRLWLLWTMQCSMDAVRLERVLPENKRGTPMMNLDRQMQALMTGCILAQAPLSQWMLPAIYVWLMRGLGKIEDYWPELAHLLPTYIMAYLREKWYCATRGDRACAHMRIYLQRAQPLRSMNDVDETIYAPLYDHILLAILCHSAAGPMSAYDQTQPLQGGYMDVLQAVEHAVGACMNLWCDRPELEDELFPPMEPGGDNKLDRYHPDHDLEETFAPTLVTELGSSSSASSSSAVLHGARAVDLIKEWCDSGLPRAIGSVLAISELDVFRPEYLAWPEVRTCRTRRGTLVMKPSMRKSEAIAIVGRAQNFAMALRHCMPGLCAAGGLESSYSTIVKSAHSFEWTPTSLGAPASTETFQADDWDIGDLSPHLELYAIPEKTIEYRQNYLRRQMALEGSRVRTDLAKRWLQGCGGDRTWDADIAPLLVTATSTYPRNCNSVVFTWSVHMAGSPRVTTPSSDNLQRRLLRSQRYFDHPSQRPVVKNASPLRNIKDRLLLHVSDQPPPVQQSSPMVDEGAFTIYASVGGLGGDHNMDVFEFDLNLEVDIQFFDVQGSALGKQERMFTVRSKCKRHCDWRHHQPWSQSVVPQTAMLYLETVPNSLY